METLKRIKLDFSFLTKLEAHKLNLALTTAAAFVVVIVLRVCLSPSVDDLGLIRVCTKATKGHGNYWTFIYTFSPSHLFLTAKTFPFYCFQSKMHNIKKQQSRL